MMNSADRLAGLLGQTIGGPKPSKRTVAYEVLGAGLGTQMAADLVGSLSPPFAGVMDLYLIGAGGGNAGGGAAGGAEAVYQLNVLVTLGSTISYVLGRNTPGAAGNASTVTVNGQLIARATGGGQAAGGTGGFPNARPGGNPGAAGAFGGAGGLAGGSAGFRDLFGAGFPLLKGADGVGIVTAGNDPGGGANGSASFGGGLPVLLLIFRET